MGHRDYLSFDGATRLALKIEDYWRRRGFDVNAWIEPVTLKFGAKQTDLSHAYIVRSDVATVCRR